MVHKVFTSLLGIVFLITSYFAVAADDKSNLFIPGAMAEGAPPELGHWGKMVGQWSTTEESLKQDGSGWQASKGADWDFFWAFNGWGIQDHYTSPPLSEKIADESKRQRGINLRIYNPKEKRWVLTWLTVKSSSPQNFTATSTEESIVMLGDKPDAKGNHSRITFFDITETSFEWKLEWSQDQEKWLEVYRIHGTRK
jgi:hypothetical protein